MLRLAYLDGSKVTWPVKKVSWAPLLGYNLLNIILFARKGVEIFFRQPHIPSETRYQGILFGVADIINN